MGAKGVFGEKEEKEDLVERETKEELVASRKGQKGTKEATKRAEKEEREEKQEETEAKDRREVASSVVGLTTPANAAGQCLFPEQLVAGWRRGPATGGPFGLHQGPGDAQRRGP